MELRREQRLPALAVAGIDRKTRTVLAYVFGRRKDGVFRKLKALLEPLGISMFYTDDWAVTSGISRPAGIRWARSIRRR